MRKIAVLFLLLLAGCARETELGAGRVGADAVLNLTIPGTRASEAPFDENSIISARLIVYHSNSPSGAKKLVLNTTDFERVNDDKMSCRKIIPAGYINVYLIANESATGIGAALAAIGESSPESDIEAIRLSYSNGLIDCKPKGITMFRAHKGLKIMPGSVIGGDGTITDADGTTITDLGQVERNAVKLDIGLICKYADATWTAGKPLTFKSATLKSVPNKPWLVAEKFYGLNDEDDDYFDVSVPEIINNSGADKVQAELTFIIPEHIVSKRNHRTYLEIECGWNGTTMTYELALGEGLTTKSNAVMKGDGTQLSDYNLLRNTIYEITATIKERGESGGENLDVYLNAVPWGDPVPVDGDILNRTLNVSATEVTFPASARVYFWSNQPNVFVEPQGYVDDGTTTFTVDAFFKTLSGVGADNITYDDAAKSSGYFDLELLESQLPGAYTRRIILNAGDLRREITIYATKEQPGGYADILYFAADGTLQVGRIGIDFDRDKMAFFKFGSVVGFTNNNDAWSNSHIKFNPMTNKSAINDTGLYGYYGDNSTTLPAIPGYVFSTDGNEGEEGFISSSGYHYKENVLNQGKGDPCKLADLTLAEIAGGKVDNGKWRLPTTKENVDFVGAPTSYYMTTSVIKLEDLNYWGSIPSGLSSMTNIGTHGGWFPVPGDRERVSGRQILNDNLAGFLPAAGQRTHRGVQQYVGAYMKYWTATVRNDTFGYELRATGAQLLPRASSNFSYGLPVRCVRVQP